MACDITGLIYLEFDWRGCGDFGAVCLVFGRTDDILIVMWNLNFAYSFSVLQPIEFLPFSLYLSEAKHDIIASSSEDVLSVFGDSHISAEFLMLTKSPVFIRLVSFHELVFKLFEVDIVFFLSLWSGFSLLVLRASFRSLLLFLFFLLLSLLNVFCFWVEFHGFNNVIVNNPDIIFIESGNWFCGIGPVWLVIVLWLFCCFVLLVVLDWWLLLCARWVDCFDLLPFNKDGLWVGLYFWFLGCSVDFYFLLLLFMAFDIFYLFVLHW